MLQHRCRGYELLRFLIVRDVVLYRVKVAVHETELQALVPDKHGHGLHRNRIDACREVFKQRLFEHVYRLQRVPEPAFRELDDFLLVLIHDNIPVLQLVQGGVKALSRYAV